MLSPYEIDTTSKVPPSNSMSRTVAHLETFRANMIEQLDAIALEVNNDNRNKLIASAREYAGMYASVPPSTPREPPAAEERCMAMRNGGKQCTRRRKGETTYCGTHMRYNQCEKSSTDPSTVVTNNTKAPTISRGAEHAISASMTPTGIPQFVDEDGNTLCAEDVCSGQVNPRHV